MTIPRYFLLKTFHRCLICGKEILFDKNPLQSHVRSHELSLEQYYHQHFLTQVSLEQYYLPPALPNTGILDTFTTFLIFNIIIKFPKHFLHAQLALSVYFLYYSSLKISRNCRRADRSGQTTGCPWLCTRMCSTHARSATRTYSGSPPPSPTTSSHTASPLNSTGRPTCRATGSTRRPRCTCWM